MTQIDPFVLYSGMWLSDRQKEHSNALISKFCARLDTDCKSLVLRYFNDHIEFNDKIPVLPGVRFACNLKPEFGKFHHITIQVDKRISDDIHIGFVTPYGTAIYALGKNRNADIFHLLVTNTRFKYWVYRDDTIVFTNHRNIEVEVHLGLTGRYWMFTRNMVKIISYTVLDEIPPEYL